MVYTKAAATISATGVLLGLLSVIAQKPAHAEICLFDVVCIRDPEISIRSDERRPSADSQVEEDSQVRDEPSTEVAQTSNQQLRPLRLYWNADREDNVTVSRADSTEWQLDSGYSHASFEGCVLVEQQAGTRPLTLFWNADRQDNATLSRPESISWQSDYGHGGVEGYVFTSQREGTIPLYLYWNDARQDNATVSSEQAVRWQEESGYGYGGVEGYIYPPSKCSSPQF